MSKTIQQTMHEQHRRWRNDQEIWRIDIDEWGKELRNALAALEAVEGMLRDSRDALEVHADAVWEDEQHLHGHELSLCQESMRGERKKTDRQWAAVHRRQTAQHERLADAHERIKKYQHQLVAEIRRLLGQARRAM
jgi:hypothetical protein